MSIRKKFLKALQTIWKQILHLSRSITQRLKNWLLRSWFVLGRRSRFSSAGFVLPTVVMVILVVILVTTAMVFRSFDRAKNASNVRVSQRVLAAVNPAIDRAEAKINALLADPNLPRGTPTDQAMYEAMTRKLPKYTFGDEEPLKLVADINGGGINKNDENESLTTAWRFPLDTDNDGKYDSFTLYGLYFRNPQPDLRTKNNRPRSPLEARSKPMDNASAGGSCGAGTAASLVGQSGWYKTSDGNLKKSFFVFAATVPITETHIKKQNLPAANFEEYSGNKGFAAIEFQQDQSRIPLTNNAVVYDDDLEITPGTGLNLNGRIMTNGNLLIGQRFTNSKIQLYQVSSIGSCFYSEENAKITVGGNVIIGSADGTTLTPPTIHLFKSGATPNQVPLTTGTVTDTAVKASYNSKAYADRINYLVENTKPLPPQVVEKVRTGTPRDKALQDYFKERTRRVPFAEVPDKNKDARAGGASPVAQGTDDMRPPAEWIYPTNLNNGAATNGLTLKKDQPPATDPEERTPEEEPLVGDRILVGNGLPAKWWDTTTKRFIDFYNQYPQSVDGNTPSTKWNPPTDNFRTRMTQVVPLSDVGDTSRDGFWERKAADVPVQPLDGIGGLRVVTGAGIYDPESKSAGVNGVPYSFLPKPTYRSNPLPRYLIPDDPSTLENESFTVLESDTPTVAKTKFRVVLPDSMPMWEDTNLDGKPALPPDTLPPNPTVNTDRRGDLVMRASVVYHYRQSNYPNPAGSDYPDAKNPLQKPIACVSSYYDPSTSLTARNWPGLPGAFIGPPGVTGNNGRSNNGISYEAPKFVNSKNLGTGTRNQQGVFITPAPLPPITGGSSWRAMLNYQANLIFPDGRFVNQPLRDALIQIDSNKPPTLAHQSAIDAALCALQIRTRAINPIETFIRHGTIYETTLLDARQVKAIEKEPIASAKNISQPRPILIKNPGPSDPAISDSLKQDPLIENYNLEVEQRQPMEIRVTVLDLDKLRTKSISGTSVVPAPEYLLPDSGIIYATRDDALPDLSALKMDENATSTATIADQRMATRRIDSPVDFVLDPSRRPNGIMLINGSKLSRGTGNQWKQEEKGLILASNLPVYIKADDKGGFNLHQRPGGGPILEEFKQPLTNANFYTRTEDDQQPLFACRQGQPGLTCNPGDTWRPATVLADSITLLSKDFRFGFRNEGDYDLRKNVENLTNNLVLSGYDFDGDPGNNNTTNLLFGETAVNIDLNGKNGIEPDTTLIKESDVTVKAARMLNGFFDNNYLTSADWSNPSGFPKDYVPTGVGSAGQQGSSYVNNFVTPIQRRAEFPEYVMEICRKPLVAECVPDDWVVGQAPNPLTVLNTDPKFILKAREIPLNTPVKQLIAGTTAGPAPRLADQRYPRRVAFLRDDDNNLVLDSESAPVAIGINSAKNVEYYSYNQTQFDVAKLNGSATTINATKGAPPTITKLGLWFKTTSTATNPTGGGNYGNDKDLGLFYLNKLAGTPAAGTTAGVGTTQQPLLVPVLQIHTPDPVQGKPTKGPTLPQYGEAEQKTWMQRPLGNGETRFNLVMAAGDSPSRDIGFSNAPVKEFNGGLPNFINTLEDWRRKQEGGGEATARISGSFIQLKRSAYATAPFLSILTPTKTKTPGSLFEDYPQAYRHTNNPAEIGLPNLPGQTGRTPYYYPPNRQFGFDVAILSQLPDLFSQQITTPSAGEPNTFYREVGRDDPWIKTLLCGVVGQKTAGNNNQYSYGGYAIADDKQRPSCPPPSSYK